MRRAMQLLSVWVYWGDAEMYCRSGLIMSRQQGTRCVAGVAVLVNVNVNNLLVLVLMS